MLEVILSMMHLMIVILNYGYRGCILPYLPTGGFVTVQANDKYTVRR